MRLSKALHLSRRNWKIPTQVRWSSAETGQDALQPPQEPSKPDPTNEKTVKTDEKNPVVEPRSTAWETKYASAGCGSDSDNFACVSPPIYFSTTFERDENLQLKKFEYSRTGNPTRNSLESVFSRLEGGVEGFACSSGMQAAFALLSACPRAHVLLPDDLYHGVSVLVNTVFAQWGVTCERVDMTNHAALKERLGHAAQSERRVLLWLETPSNPLCKVTDVQKICEFARDLIKPERLVVAVDSTWCSPFLLRPLELGADFALHSMTKYVGGHSDIMGGMLVAANTVGASLLLPALRTVHQVGGGVCGPFEAWMALRGLRTLPVRMKQHCENAMAVAEYLEGHPRVDKVFYPGLETHPQHALAAEQMGGRFGGMLSFLVKSKSPNSGEEALQVVKGVEVFRRATSLGGTESLIEHRASVEGVHGTSPKNLLRVSVGLEDIGDLLADLDLALNPDN